VTIRGVSSSASIDDKIIAALRELDRRFDAEFRSSIDGIDAWVRQHDADAPVIALLERDPVVADHLAIPGQLFLMTAHGGVEYQLHDSIVGFLRQLRIGGLPFDAEAERFLRSVRVTGGVVPALIRIVIFGFTVSEPAGLPFGQLVPAMRRDIALPKLQGDPPQAVVLETIRDVPAVVADTNNHPWIDQERDRRAAATDEAINEPLDRLMVALAVSYANPIQEHLVCVGALYAGGSIGRNPLPIGAALINLPPDGVSRTRPRAVEAQCRGRRAGSKCEADRYRSSPLLRGHLGESAASRQVDRPRDRDRGTDRGIRPQAADEATRTATSRWGAK